MRIIKIAVYLNEGWWRVDSGVRGGSVFIRAGGWYECSCCSNSEHRYNDSIFTGLIWYSSLD